MMKINELKDGSRGRFTFLLKLTYQRSDQQRSHLSFLCASGQDGQHGCEILVPIK